MPGSTAMHAVEPARARWWLGRLRGRWHAEVAPAASVYPVLSRDDLADPSVAFTDLAATGTNGPVVFPLPGQMARPAAGTDPFATDETDFAAKAALYAFSWALAAEDPTSAMRFLWPLWLERHQEDKPAWEPAVAATRAVALLDFARRFGLPQPRERTIMALVDHVPALATALAGRPATLDVPARCGHALWRLGLDLGLEKAAELGFAVLSAEAARLVLPSGVSALESTGGHLALTALYADAWLAARRSARAETAALEQILGNLLGAVHALTLPGGLPLFGEVPALLPGGWYDGLLRGRDGAKGWTGTLAEAERRALLALRDDRPGAELAALHQDGWLRLDLGAWSGLWHCPAQGWPRERALGHADLGACVLHYDGVPVLVDAGGSSLGTVNGAGFCQTPEAHGGLTLNGLPPYPFDRDEYSEAFRRAVGGPPPSLRADYDGATLALQGFNRLGGPREVRRCWRFEGNRIEIADTVNGTGRFDIARRILTPLTAKATETGFLLEGAGRRFALSLDAPGKLVTGEIWPGFGASGRLSVIEVRQKVNIPWRGRIVLEAV